MKTVFGSLPFYNSTDKQDVVRTKALIPIHCPRTQLPPFQFDLGSDTIATVDKIELIDSTYTGAEATAGTDWWLHVGFAVFTHAGLEISAAVGAGAVCQASSRVGATVRGTQIRVIGTLTLNAGTVPSIFTDGAANITSLAEGANNIILTCTKVSADGSVSLYFNGATDYSFTGVTITRITGALNITNFFPTLPQPYMPTDTDFDPYLKYNGTTLNYLLPLGVYYVKITGNGYVYVSDYIRIDNLYPNLATSLTNISYDTFTKSGTTVLSAIETVTDGRFRTNIFSVKKGEVITVVFYLTQNSGTVPQIRLRNNSSSSTISNIANASAGLNIISLTPTVTIINADLRFENTSASDYSTSEILVSRAYSPNFLKINFRNTDNFGDLLYEESQKQTVWLEAILNNPTHEMVNVGEEKDGIFIAEKITSKLIYSIIAYISRGMYQCLMRLPQHDSITITDEVGNTYTPAVGNLTVDPLDWVTYETGKIVIRFNDNSSFSWTT